MFNKVYEKTKNYIKENYKSLLIIILFFLLITIKLPYYISAPGGAINIKDKIEGQTFEFKGSLNMAYVSQIDGTLPMLAFALINPNWDIEKESDVTVGNETIENEQYRNKLMLEEAKNTALVVAYNYSKIKYKITNNKIYVTYIDKTAKTNLKVGDQIIKINGKKIKEKQNLYDAIENNKIGDKIKLTVIRNKEKRQCSSTLINVNGKPKVGIIITETMDIKSNKDIQLKFKKTESGSSGGLMLTLTIYSYLNKIDLTNGKKIVGTGTIDLNGNVGQISGVKYKLIGAVKEKADIFIVPKGKNYKTAKKLKQKRGYDIDIIPVSTFEETVKYLKEQKK